MLTDNKSRNYREEVNKNTGYVAFQLASVNPQNRVEKTGLLKMRAVRMCTWPPKKSAQGD